jgi:hypothetical protein
MYFSVFHTDQPDQARRERGRLKKTGSFPEIPAAGWRLLEMLNYKSAAFSACPGPSFPLRGAAAPVKLFAAGPSLLFLERTSLVRPRSFYFTNFCFYRRSVNPMIGEGNHRICLDY